MHSSEATIRSELAWLANGYVAGELSADETAAFEARMETDIAACDAVACAMKLNLAVAAAFDSQPSTLVFGPRRFLRPAGRARPSPHWRLPRSRQRASR